MSNDRNIVLSNLIWRFGERFGAQGVTLVVSIALARRLEPNAYGIIAIVTVFTSILQVFVDSGLGTALVQKKEVDDLDYSTVFWFNCIMCIVLYILLYISSPVIATFYGMPELNRVIRVVGITIIISGLKNIQQAYVARNMMFRKFFFATLTGTLGAAALGIILAYNNCGVWALVAQNLFNLVADTLLLWITVKWRPIATFSFKRLKVLYSFGWKILVSSLLNTIYNNLRKLIIGKKYTPEDLAYFNKGEELPSLIVININTSIDSVLLPAMSKAQAEKAKIRYMTRRAIKTTTYLLAPLMIGFAACAKPLIRLVLTEKWIPCVPYLQIISLAYMFQSIQTSNLNAIKAIGRSDVFLRLEVIRKSIGILIVIVASQISVYALAWSVLLFGIISQIINSFPNRKLIEYSYFDQVHDIIPTLSISVIMASVVALIVQYVKVPDFLLVFLSIFAGITVYIGLSISTHNENYYYILSSIKEQINQQRDR